MNTQKALWILTVAVVLLFCGTRWADAYFGFGEPVSLKSVIPVLNHETDDIECFSFDGLELYFSSQRPGGYGDFDLWVLRRASRDQDWGPPENLGPVINSSKEDSFSSISADGLTLYFSSNRSDGYGSYDIYMTTRVTRDGPWSTPVNLGPTVNSSACDGEAWISGNGLELHFESYRSGGYGSADIYVARRTTTNDPWGEPVNLGPVVNSPYGEQFLSLSPDGLLLLFSDHTLTTTPRPGGYGAADMWMTRRATLSDPWQSPVNLGPKVNGSEAEGIPRISLDGQTLYFWSKRSGTWENWQAPIVPIVDFNGDGKVDSNDQAILMDHWGQNDPLCDIGPFAWGDGVVDDKDLSVLAKYIGKDIEDPTLVAHWAMDEAEGMIAHDSAGKNDAIVIGNADWQPEGGKVGGALQLSGVKNFAMTGFVLNPSNPPFTVLAWVKGGAPGQVILSQAGGANWLLAQPGTGFLMSDLKYHPLLTSAISQTVITDGAWHRVGFVWDGANRILYVDGVEVARGAQSALPDSTGGLYIGGGSTMAPGTLWKGLIDDVRIYNRVVRP